MVIDGCIGSDDFLSSVIFGGGCASHSISFFVPVAHCYLCGWLMVAWHVTVHPPLVEKAPVPWCGCYGD